MHNVWLYVKECFRVAAEHRQGWGAMISLILALLVWPIYYAVGGVVVLRDEWIVAAALISGGWAFFYLVFVVPYKLWNKIRLHAVLPDLLGFVQFRGVAERQFGWDFSDGTFQSMDLIKALIQAASKDGGLVIDGSVTRADDPIVVTTGQRLDSIGAFFWKNPHAYIDIPTLFRGEDNRQTTAYVFGEPEKSERYYNLHFHDRLQAIEWLRLVSKTKGQTKAEREATRALAETKERENYGAKEDERANTDGVGSN